MNVHKNQRPKTETKSVGTSGLEITGGYLLVNLLLQTLLLINVIYNRVLSGFPIVPSINAVH